MRVKNKGLQAKNVQSPTLVEWAGIARIKFFITLPLLSFAGGGAFVLKVSSPVSLLFSQVPLEQYHAVLIRLVHGCKSHTCNSPYLLEIYRKEVKIIKEITKQEMDLLIKKSIVINTNHGYVDNKGSDIGFYRTKGVAKKRYVKDKYVNMLRNSNEESRWMK